MTLSTFTDLTSAVADWLDRADLSARIPDFVALAETQMNRTLRVCRMIARASAALDGPFIPLPDDFLEAVALTMSDGAAIVPAPLQAMAQGATGIGQPQRYALFGDELQVSPPPAPGTSVTLTYYARIPPLTAAAATNWLLAAAPDVYLYGALLQAAPYLRDGEAVALWNGAFEGALGALKAADRTAVGALKTEPGLWAARAATTLSLEA